MSQFLHDYWTYNSCYEMPRNFAIGACLGLLSAVVNRKVYIRCGDIEHTASLYICLVGEQGGGKSTAKDFARDTYIEVFPDASVSSSVASREAILKFLGSDEAIRTYKDSEDTLIEYRPYALFINELKNFISINPTGMLDFLTDIYDRRMFKNETKNKGIDTIINPAVTILACETPSWIINKMKENIITGGFSRRVIMVYEFENDRIIPRPNITPEARAAWNRIKEALLNVSRLSGEFKWDPEGGEFFDHWYTENKKSLPHDPVMRGYRKTKDVQLLKCCMLIAATEPKPTFLMTRSLLETGLSVLNTFEVNMSRLSMGAGRNELAVPMHHVLEELERAKGWLSEKELKNLLDKDLNPSEQFSILRHLEQTERIVIKDRFINNVKRRIVFLRDVYIKLAADDAIRSKPSLPVPPTEPAGPQT